MTGSQMSVVWKKGLFILILYQLINGEFHLHRNSQNLKTKSLVSDGLGSSWGEAILVYLETSSVCGALGDMMLLSPTCS